MTAALICARGGSKRLPRKNVKLFCGIPLVAWSIIQAKCSHLIDEVYLSTDDDEIAGVGDEYGAQVIRRPDWPDADLLQANKPMIHMAEAIMAHRDDLEVVVPILPTNPCYYPDDTDRLIKRWHELNERDAEVALGHRCRTMIVYKDIGNGRIGQVIFDKTPGKYLQGFSHRSVFGIDFYLEVMRSLSVYDKAEDDARAAPGWVENPPACRYRMLDCQLWQTTVDVDTLEEFELGEVLMEHYILHGRGPDIYYEYAEEYNK